jgi:hypothetical protein
MHIKVAGHIFILGSPCIIYKFVLFLYQLDTLNFLFTSTILGFLYMFRTDRSIIKKIKCLITQAASGTVPSVVDLLCVAVGVRLFFFEFLLSFSLFSIKRKNLCKP